MEDEQKRMNKQKNLTQKLKNLMKKINIKIKQKTFLKWTKKDYQERFILKNL